MSTKTTRTLFGTSLRTIHVLVILSMLLSTVGITPVRAAVVNPQTWINVYHNATLPAAVAIPFTISVGSDRMLVAAISSTQTATGAQTASVTYGGQTLTKQVTDETGAYRQHTWLFYLKEAGIQAATNSNLTVTITGGTGRMNDVFATVFTGVDQSASPIRDSKNYTSGTSTATNPVFAAALTVNAKDQAVEVINQTRSANTTLLNITYATNWTMSAQNTFNTTDFIRNAVAIRSIPPSNATDTSSTTFSGAALGSMSAMSIKPMAYSSPPTAPTGLFATQDSGAVNLRWTAPSSGDLAGYNVYRSTSPSVPLTGPINGGIPVPGTIYTDNGRTNGTPYYYVVTAVDTSANQSVASNEVSATPLASLGSAVQFDGTNDYVTFGANLNATSFTLEAWVKRDASGTTMSTGTNGFDGLGGRPSAAYPVLTKGMGEGETPANINMNYFLGITSTGVVGADFEDNINGGNRPIWGNTVVPPGQWHHIAATYTGTC